MSPRPAILLWAAALSAATVDPRLADAAKRTDRTAVRKLLNERLDPNAAQVDGTTALHWAANRDDVETAELLIQSGADAKAANRYGVTPLSLACVNGNAAMVRLLLKAGADANLALPGGETPLMTSARTGRVEAVKALLESGAVVDAKEERRKQTALMWAASEGHAEVVRALIAAGADLKYRLPSGFTPLLFAVREGRIDATKALLAAGADVNDAIKTSLESGRRLIYGGLARSGTSALILAVANAHYQLASELLDAGADPNAMGPGYSALHTITWIRRPGGGDNDPAPYGSGSLSSLDFVRKLKAKGADFNARMTRKVNVGLTSLNTSGATAFLLAARTGDAELMRLLASLGADPLIPNADNSTPLIVAAGVGTRSPGEDAGTEPEVVEAIKAALELGNDINAVDNNGETAMHGAAYKNLPGAVRILQERGAKMDIWNRKNSFGWTPLYIAEGYRFGNFKPSPDTIAVLRQIMTAAGASIAIEPGVINR